MAGLADDWEESRQTCVDVLCADLRMPYEPDPGQDAPALELLAFRAIREIRHTVIRVVDRRLRMPAEVSWQGLSFDFSGEVPADETREYGTWADWLGVPRHVFSAVVGTVIARGQYYREGSVIFRSHV